MPQRLQRLALLGHGGPALTAPGRADSRPHVPERLQLDCSRPSGANGAQSGLGEAGQLAAADPDFLLTHPHLRVECEGELAVVLAVRCSCSRQAGGSPSRPRQLGIAKSIRPARGIAELQALDRPFGVRFGLRCPARLHFFLQPEQHYSQNCLLLPLLLVSGSFGGSVELPKCCL